MISQNPTPYIIAISVGLSAIAGWGLMEFIKATKKLRDNQNSLRRKFLKNAINCVGTEYDKTNEVLTKNTNSSNIRPDLDKIQNEIFSTIFKNTPDLNLKLIFIPIAPSNYHIALTASIIPAILTLVSDDILFLTVSFAISVFVWLYYFVEATYFWFTLNNID